jgi:hypothetical protein
MTRLPDPMVWLTEGLPLTLLLDLLDEHGPNSRAILLEEGGDAAWLARSTTAA